MKSGLDLLIEGRWDAALPRLRASASREKHDPFQAGDKLDYGVALIELRRLQEAEAHIRQLKENAVWRSTEQPAYLGVIEWVRGNAPAAVEKWLQCDKCGYASLRGLDGALLLWYASVLEPSCVPAGVPSEMARKWMDRIQSTSFYHTLGLLLLGECKVEDLTARAKQDVALSPSGGLVSLQYALFYAGVARLAERDHAGFLEGMWAAATLPGVDRATPERVLARFEAERGGGPVPPAAAGPRRRSVKGRRGHAAPRRRKAK